MKNGLFFILLMGLLFSSCKDQQKEKYLTRLDNLHQSLDSMKTIVQNTHPSKLDSISHIVSTTLTAIKKNYKNDTISLDFANKIEAYKEIVSAFSTNSGNLAKVETTIPVVLKKVHDLRHDIDNGVNDRDKYNEFVSYEEKNEKQIKAILTYYISTNKKYVRQFDSLQPIMKKYEQTLTAGGGE